MFLFKNYKSGDKFYSLLFDSATKRENRLIISDGTNDIVT